MFKLIFNKYISSGQCNKNQSQIIKILNGKKHVKLWPLAHYFFFFDDWLLWRFNNWFPLFLCWSGISLL